MFQTAFGLKRMVAPERQTCDNDRPIHIPRRSPCCAAAHIPHLFRSNPHVRRQKQSPCRRTGANRKKFRQRRHHENGRQPAGRKPRSHFHRIARIRPRPRSRRPAARAHRRNLRPNPPAKPHSASKPSPNARKTAACAPLSMPNTPSIPFTPANSA